MAPCVINIQGWECNYICSVSRNGGMGPFQLSSVDLLAIYSDIALIGDGPTWLVGKLVCRCLLVLPKLTGVLLPQ